MLTYWLETTCFVCCALSGMLIMVAGLADGAEVDPVHPDGTTRLRLISTVKGHEGRVQAVVFAPDGNVLASCGDDNVVRLWDVRTWELTGVLAARESLYAIAFSPNGRQLAAGGLGATVRLWSIAERREIGTFRPNVSTISALYFLSDGHTLLVESPLWPRDAVVLLDVHTREERLIPHWAGTVAISPCRTRVALAGTDNEVYLWDLEASRMVRRFTAVPREAGAETRVGFGSLSFSPDGQLLAISFHHTRGPDPFAALWELDPPNNQIATVWAGSPRESRRMVGYTSFAIPTPIAFSPDGRFVALAGKVLTLWEVETGRTVSTADDGPSNNLAFSPTSELLAVASFDGTVRVYALPELDE